MHPPSLIEKKRDGGELSGEEISALISGFTEGTIPDYQISALAMAIYFSGMTPGETADLTRAMIESGDVFRYPDGHPRVVDKHSTGGIGDKVSLVLAPLLACDDLWVPMVSGRGLGITGGTLDKLESIPGFSINLELDQALAQLGEIGVVMMGQTATFCPADKKLYALRDVTATVPSIPLIAASIMSKKLAESLDALVLDVKFGSGAFMRTRAEAQSLAAAMQSVGDEMGVVTRTLLTPMDEPLGCAVGNALEVIEAVDCLHGGGPPDLRALTLDLAVSLSELERSRLERWLDDGTAWAKFLQLVEAQGGNPGAFEKPLHPAPVIRDIPSPRSGTLIALEAGTVGRASLALGAGRRKTTDRIDYAVGFDHLLKTGTAIEKGEPLARVHARSDADAADAVRALLDACKIS
ncbi:MAG: thymidine phosphorylase [Verrucomicrobiales bacterium]